MSLSDNAPATATDLWENLFHAETEDDASHSLLALLCTIIPNTRQAILVSGPADSGPYRPTAQWPPQGEDPQRLAELSERVLEQQSGLLVDLLPPTTMDRSHYYGLGYPLVIDGLLHGVITVEVVAESEDELRGAMEQLQKGSGWFELFFRRGQAKEDKASIQRMRNAVDLLAATLAEKKYVAAALSFVTELSTILDCDRISLGSMRRHHIKIEAMSHSAHVDKRTNLLRALSASMEECTNQGKEIFYPAVDDGASKMLITHDHELLARQHGGAALLTIPLYDGERYYGALTLERKPENPYSREELLFVSSIADLAGPALEAKRLNDRSLPGKILDAATIQLTRLFGPRYIGRKLIALTAVILVLFFTFATGPYQLAADSTLEGEVRRMISAPFNGYIKEAFVRAGDVVSKGEILCTLDDRDLRLERQKWLSQRSQFQRQHQEAFAKHERAQVNIINAQLEQAAAQLELLEAQMERTRVQAPFDGLVVRGDLSQMLGSMITQGEVLFEIAPLNAYRLILKIDERRITDVAVGQEGKLMLASLPQEHYPFIVRKVTPQTTAEEGQNTFRVEAQLVETSPHLRPGMEGVGKISVDRRRLISIWTRDLVEWFKLWLWSWWP
jgi:multidrug resistance efflux pump